MFDHWKLLTCQTLRRITLSITNPGVEDADILSLEISPDTTVESLRASIQGETQIHPTSQHLYHNGNLINDNTKTMEQLRIGGRVRGFSGHDCLWWRHRPTGTLAPGLTRWLSFIVLC